MGPGTAVFSLEQNFPNPFNPTTGIRYQIAGTAAVSLTVYDLLGQAVRTLVNEIKDAGSYEAVWDGRNDQGQNVGSGIFFYRLQAGTFVETRRMVLLK
jgi:flagellar hook assembly protein FlgD